VDIREVHVDYVDHVERLRCWTRGRFHDTINIDKSVVDNYFWRHNEGPNRLRLTQPVRFSLIRENGASWGRLPGQRSRAHGDARYVAPYGTRQGGSLAAASRAPAMRPEMVALDETME